MGRNLGIGCSPALVIAGSFVPGPFMSACHRGHTPLNAHAEILALKSCGLNPWGKPLTC